MSIITEISKKVRSVFHEIAEECAEATGLVQRKGKVTGSNLSQTLVFGWLSNPDATLEALSQMGRALSLEISAQGLDQRFTEVCSQFFHQLLLKVIAYRVGWCSSTEAKRSFSNVYLRDSSIVSLPKELSCEWRGNNGKGTASTVKLETQMEILSGALDGPHLLDGRVNDNKAARNHEDLKKGELLLCDLGYWKLDRFKDIADQEAWFVSHFKISTCFWVDNEKWGIYEWCQKLGKGSADIDIQLGAKAKVPCRLIVQRVPNDVAAERKRKRRRAIKKRGDTPTKASMALCHWTIVVTNIPVEKASLEEILSLLKLRWQIELLFRSWKSQGKIDVSRSQNKWRRLCELYAKLIAMVIKQWIFVATIWRFPDRSFDKATSTIVQHTIRLAIAIVSSYKKTVQLLLDLKRILNTGCRINKSKKSKRHFEIVEEICLTTA